MMHWIHRDAGIATASENYHQEMLVGILINLDIHDTDWLLQEKPEKNELTDMLETDTDRTKWIN